MEIQIIKKESRIWREGFSFKSEKGDKVDVKFKENSFFSDPKVKGVIIDMSEECKKKSPDR